MQNKRWGIEKKNELLSATRHIQKTKLLYVNFSPRTHPSREEAFVVAKGLKEVTIESDIPYKDYLQNLGEHKFCLCPRGNGIDTHRFWEAQYLDCIPVILWQDWTASYSGLPVLILQSWDELRTTNFEKMYIFLTSKYYDRSSLNLNIVRKEIVS